MGRVLFQREALIDWGVASRALPGEEVTGDAHLVMGCAQGALTAVIDGVGHGEEATVAARTALSILRANSGESLVTLFNLCHEALAKTRGAVMTVAIFDGARRALSWLSVGNVSGLLMRADPKTEPARQSSLARAGVVGHQLPLLQPDLLRVAAGDLLILASDGIRNDFDGDILPAGPPGQIAARIMNSYFKGRDDAIVLAVRFLGGAP